MASYTASRDGLWSSTSTWGGSGPPGNGDTVTIPSGITVTFDVDQSGFASGLSGLTVNGTLKWKTDTKTYLKMASNVNISGTGTLQVGEESNPIQRPPSGSSTRATIKLQGTGKITVPNLLCYGWDERLNRTTVALPTSSGNQIKISDDMNLQPGDQIVIGSGTVKGALTETAKGIYTVSSYSSSSRTITLSSAIEHTRNEGDFVGLYNRTITLDGGTDSIYSPSTPGTATFRGVLSNRSIGTTSPNNSAPSDMILGDHLTLTSSSPAGKLVGDQKYQNFVKDSTFYNVHVNWSPNTTFKDTIHIHNESVSYGFVSHAAGAFFDNCWFQNGYAVVYKELTLGHGFSYHRGCKAMNLSSRAYGYRTHKIEVYDMDFTGINPTDSIYYPMRFYDCIFSTIAIDYGAGATGEGFFESFNHNKEPGNYHLYQHGGVTVKDTTNKAPGKDYSLKTSLSSNKPVVVGKNMGTLEPGETIYLSAW
ncbi:MAG TPA: G8 domain-containing protein, partial [Candidatus Hydrothermia bacterium]|nr:G8 domain-containing protein [Candidatus Hydrothermia bacterium]